MPYLILGIILSYLIGSIPPAYLLGRLWKRIDIRKAGSGNIGATNALRVLGKKAGITILILDILKGIIPVIFLGDFIIARLASMSGEAIRIILGISCICGHNWTIFLRFKGGKGIATSLGVLLGLSLRIPGLNLVLGLVIGIWLIVLIISRIVSLASLLAGISLPIFMLVFRLSSVLVWASLVLCVMMVLRHRPNIKRLLQGKEPRIDFKKH